MTPYVIDKQKQNQLLLIFIASLVVSFFLGYAFGFQSGLLDGADGFALVPEQEKPAEAAADIEQVPVAEQPEPIDTATKIEPVKSAEKPKVTAAEVKEVKKVVKAEPRKAPVVAKPKPVNVTKSEPIATETQQKQASSTAESTNKTDTPKEASTDIPVSGKAAENDKPADTPAGDKMEHFSIQAGMFESRENALKFIEELKSNGFEAYLSDFVSSSGGVKYNVRFGSFDDRQQVEEKLALFKQKFTSPAYIVINK